MQLLDIRQTLVHHPHRKYGVRLISAITHIAVHHSATVTGSAEAYAHYHVEHHRWPGIGYHYVVERDGRIKKCNSLSTVSYHVGPSNRIAIGICCTGDYDQVSPPAIQLKAAAELIAELMRALPQLTVSNIWGHTQFPGYAKKSCPGKRYPLPRLRELVTAQLHAHKLILSQKKSG